MRAALTALLMLLCGASALAEDQPSLTKLEMVFDHPVASNNRMFEGYAYLYVGETAYYFFPHKVTSETGFESFSAYAMPGTGADMAEFARHKTGERLRIEARIDVDLPCFTGSLCAPWRHPIFLKGLKIVQ